jgi:hypothetical protein
MEVSFVANRWHKQPSLCFSVSCLLNGDCSGRRSLCGMAFWDKISHSDSTKLPQCIGLRVHQTYHHWIFPVGVVSRAVCSEHQLTDLMTWRPVSGMRSQLFQRTSSTEQDKSSNIAWTFSVVRRESTSRSTKLLKNFQSFFYDLPQTAYG